MSVEYNHLKIIEAKNYLSRMRIIYFFFGFLFFAPLQAQVDPAWIIPVRDQAAWVDSMLEYRIDQLLPELMNKQDIDMWVLVSREYNEDPVMKTMLPSSWLSARRRTIFVFAKNSNGDIDKIAIARYSVGKLLKGEWNIDVFPDQWEALIDYIEERDPKTIGLNFSKDFGLADGIVQTEYASLLNKLPEQYQKRIVSAEDLAISWLETRSPMEIDIYAHLCKIGHQILQEAFSAEVIEAGVSSTEDVVWWLRQRVIDLGLQTWFHPTVSIQRADDEKFDHLRSFSKRPGQHTIQYGDLLHVDFGISYLRLNTDQQQHFYMLKPGETEVPSYLAEAFKVGNRLQEILVNAFKAGKTGNQILKESLDQAKKEGILASIYTHPIGFHGHAAGPTIGMWDQQGGVPGRGDYELFPNTAYSIELNASTEITEWGKVIRIMLEEDGIFTTDGFSYPDGRQRAIYAIPR